MCKCTSSILAGIFLVQSMEVAPAKTSSSFQTPFLNGVDYINFLIENGYFLIFFTAMNANLWCLLCLIVWGDNSIVDDGIEKWKRRLLVLLEST